MNMLAIKMVLMSFTMNCMCTTMFSEHNPAKMFHFFKEKYHKNYKNSTYEESALKNFINNLNKVSALNEKSKDNDTILVPNKYADLDAEEFEEHYGIHLVPYKNDTLHREYLKHMDGLRNRIDIKQLKEDNSVEYDQLYDLDDANNIYKNYMKKYEKKNASNTYDQTVQYYRFIKTIAELNKQHYQGDKSNKLDKDSNVVKKPFEYIY